MNREAEALFHELADLSHTQRETFFRERHVSAELRAEVEQLLRFDAEADDSLAGYVAASARELLQAKGDVEEKGRCGPYRLTRVLGRGGMGSVHLAERSDGEVQHKVAVKILRYGGEEPLFLDRFLQERQILASLSHPGIGRLFDAGHTDEGLPYLVMEYIDGAPIDVYAERLDLRSKLRLFLRLCDAVSYAHRNLVIHRDLKPSNVLVDHSGQPKLLDFGIAKIMDAAVDQTRTQERLLTPEYASPEQVRGSSWSAASDIYSLGALLYKLLTGRSPHAFASSSRQAIEFAICLEEPPAPGVVNPALPRDLDFIVSKALRKEPEERYGSADAFASDIQAFLESRPVRARSGSAWYRTRKFLRRYWVPATAAALVIVSLATGLYLTARERAVAQRRFLEVRQLAHTFVFDLHDEIAKLEGSTKTRQMMVQTGLQYLDKLAGDAGNDLGLWREIAAAYVKIGDAQGHPTSPNLGRVADALESYHKAGDIYRGIAARDSVYLPDLASYYLKYAGLIRFTNDLKQARNLSESAIHTFDDIRARQRPDPKLEAAYVGAWCTLGDMDEDMGEFRRAWSEFLHCRELARARLSLRRDVPSLSALSQADERVGTAAHELGHFTEALSAFDEDQSVLAEMLAAEPHNPVFHRRQALVHLYRSTVYYDEVRPNLGNPARSLESARRYLDATDEMVRSDPTNTSAQFSRAVAKSWVSVPLREFNAPAAVSTARDSVRKFDELIASGKTSYLIASRRIRALRRLGEAQLKAGRVTEASRSAEAALAAERPLAGQSAPESEEHTVLVQVLLLTSATSIASGGYGRAESLLREARDEAERIAGRRELSHVVPLARSEEALGAFYARRRRNAEARACYERLAGLWQRFPEPNEYVDGQRASSARLLASLQ